MGRPIRHFEPGGIYFVTARTVQGRLLLRPSTLTNEIVGGVLARAIRLYRVELFAFAVASNHLHLLVRSRDGQLSTFMQYVLSNIARKVSAGVGWTGTFWGRRYSSEPVLDPGALLGRFKYTLAHGVKEGLVRTVREWPGLNCLELLLADAPRTFKFYSWTRRWKGGRLLRPSMDRFSATYAEDEVLELAPLPVWAELSPDRRRAKLNEVALEIDKAASQQFARVVGAEAVKQQNPQSIPPNQPRSNRPPCHATNRSLREGYVMAYRAFAEAYAAASREFRRGNFLVRFPPHAHRPPVRPMSIVAMSPVPTADPVLLI